MNVQNISFVILFKNFYFLLFIRVCKMKRQKNMNVQNISSVILFKIFYFLLFIRVCKMKSKKKI